MYNEPILAKIIRWGLWSSALIPLIIFKEYISPFHFGKVIVFRSVIEVLLAMYLVLIWQDKSYRPKLDWIGWGFLGFSLAYTLSTILSIAPFHSMWGTLERMGGLFSFWHYFVFYIMLTSVLRDRRQWQVLLELVIVSGVLSAFYGFLQKTDWQVILGGGGRLRPFGTIGNAALFAGYQILIAFLAGTLSFRQSISQGHRWWYRFAAATTMLAAIMTAVRGSLIAIVVGIFVFALLWSVVFRSRRARLGLLGVIGTVALFAIFSLAFKNTAFVQNSGYLRRVTDFSPQTYTVKTRFWTWQSGLNGWKESPKTVLVGWGPENFNVPFSKYFNPQHFNGPGSETFFDRAHNNFVDVLVTMGLVGEAAYLGWFVAIFWLAWLLMKRDNDDRLIGIGMASATVAYMIHNAFIFDTSANFITFFTLIGFMSFVKAQPDDAKQLQKQLPGGGKPMSALQLAVLIVLLIISIMTLARINIRPAKANHTTTRAIIAGWQGQFPESIRLYKEATAFNTFGIYEERHRLAQYLLEINAQLGGELPAPYAEALEFGISEVEKNTLFNDQDYLPLLYLARMHIILGKQSSQSPHNQIALDYTNQALEISPTFVRSYYEIAQAYLNLGDLEHAYEYFAKAQQLNPDVGITYWYMGIVRVQIGDAVGGLELINQSVDHGYVLSAGDTERIIAVYASLNDFTTVIELLEGLLEDNPERAQYWASLGAAYEAAGRMNEGVEAMERAIELDSGFKDEGEKVIRRMLGEEEPESDVEAPAEEEAEEAGGAEE